MNYYEHHLGDYVRDTAHLSMLEEGAYLRLLHQYYIREKPLPADSKECWRLARATTKSEQKAVDYVLRQFFDLRDGGYHQGRTDREIERFRAKSEAGKVGANARWSHNGRNANGHANALQSQSVGNALQTPVSNPQSPGKNSTPQPPFARGASGETRSERRTRQQEALQRWNRLINSGGADREGLGTAITAVGGWPAIRMRTENDEARMRKAFCDAYIGGAS